MGQVVGTPFGSETLLIEVDVLPDIKGIELGEKVPSSMTILADG